MRSCWPHLCRLCLYYRLGSFVWLLLNSFFSNFFRGLFLLLLHAAEILQNFDQHLLLLLHIGLVSIAHKFHIYFATLLFHSIALVFLFKMVKVFVRYLRLHFWLIRSFAFPQICPVKPLKKWMSLNFIRAVATQTHFGVIYHF